MSEKEFRVRVKQIEHLESCADPLICVVWSSARVPKQKKESTLSKKKNNPVWKEPFVLSLATTPTAKIFIDIWNHTEKVCLGNIVIPVVNVLQTGKLTLKSQPLTAQKSQKSTTTPTIDVEVTILAARDLKARGETSTTRVPPPVPPRRTRSTPNTVNSLATLEFISSEKTYVAELEMIVRTLIVPLVELKILSQLEVQQTFLNLNEIYRLNKSFYEELEQRAEENENNPRVADVISRYLNQFNTPYSEHVRRQSEAAQFGETLLQTNQGFRKFIEAGNAEWNPHEWNLEEYLSKPLLRLTRYPTHLNAMIKTLPRDSEASLQLQQAIQKIYSIVEHANMVSRNERDVKHTHHTWMRLSQTSCASYLKENIITVDNLGLTDEPVIYFRTPKALCDFQVHYGMQRKSPVNEGTLFLFEHSLFISKGRETTLAPLSLIPLRSLQVRESLETPENGSLTQTDRNSLLNAVSLQQNNANDPLDWQKFAEEFLAREQKFLAQLDQCKINVIPFLTHPELQVLCGPLRTHLSKLHTQFRCMRDELSDKLFSDSVSWLEVFIMITQRLALIETYGTFLLELVGNLFRVASSTSGFEQKELSSHSPETQGLGNTLRGFIRICGHPRVYRDFAAVVAREFQIEDKPTLGTIRLIDTSVSVTSRLMSLFQDALEILELDQKILYSNSNSERLFATGRRLEFQGTLRRVPSGEILQVFLFNNLFVTCTTQKLSEISSTNVSSHSGGGGNGNLNHSSSGSGGNGSSGTSHSGSGGKSSGKEKRKSTANSNSEKISLQASGKMPSQANFFLPPLQGLLPTHSSPGVNALLSPTALNPRVYSQSTHHHHQHHQEPKLLLDQRVDLLEDGLKVIELSGRSFQLMDQRAKHASGRQFEAISDAEFTEWMTRLKEVLDQRHSDSQKEILNQRANNPHAQQELHLVEFTREWTLRFPSSSQMRKARFQIQQAKNGVLLDELQRISPFYLRNNKLTENEPLLEELIPGVDGVSSLLSGSPVKWSPEEKRLLELLQNQMAKEFCMASLGSMTLDHLRASEERISIISTTFKNQVVAGNFSVSSNGGGGGKDMSQSMQDDHDVVGVVPESLQFPVKDPEFLRGSKILYPFVSKAEKEKSEKLTSLDPSTTPRLGNVFGTLRRSSIRRHKKSKSLFDTSCLTMREKSDKSINVGD